MGRLGRSQPGSWAQSKKRNSPKPVRSTRLRNCLGMIWSVSTSSRSSTLTGPSMTVMGSMARVLLAPVADVDEVALDRRGGGHLRRDEVRAPAAALAALEVAVRRRRAALAWLENVGVHAQAHRAARAAPVEAGGREDLVEPFGLGLLLDLHGAR